MCTICFVFGLLNSFMYLNISIICVNIKVVYRYLFLFYI